MEKCATADATLLDLSKYRRKEFNHADKMWKGLPVSVPAGHVGMPVPFCSDHPLSPQPRRASLCERARRRKSTPLGALRVARHLTWLPRRLKLASSGLLLASPTDLGHTHSCRVGHRTRLQCPAAHQCGASLRAHQPHAQAGSLSPSSPRGVCHLGQFKLRPPLIVTTGQQKTQHREKIKIGISGQQKQHREQIKNWHFGTKKQHFVCH